MKKMISLVLALCMVLMVGSVYAEGNAEPSEFARGGFTGEAETTITATNLDSGDNVEYIKLVEWDGTSDGTEAQNAANGWRLTTKGLACGVTLEELLNGITAGEAATIASSLAETVKDGEMTTNGTTATANASTGLYYLRAIATSDDTIYNPAFVSADYYLNGNTVSFGSNIGSSSVVKKSSVSFDKQVGHGSEHDYSYNDVKPGDYIPFKITSKIPAYGAAYDNAKFEITDTFSTGLVLAIDDSHPFSVAYGNANGNQDGVTDVYTSTASDGGASYKIEFATPYLLNASRGVTDVTISYWGKVTSDAPTNVNPLDNTADLKFTNKPGETKDKQDITRHYTFSIDAGALGKENSITRELMKIGLDQNGEPITDVTNETVHETVVAPLAGASFTLTPVAPTTGTAKTVTSDATGRIVFKGLDAGEYTLVEDSAPTGYVKDSRTYTVKIIPTYDETIKDLLKSYKIEFWLGQTKVTTASFACSGETKVTESTIEDATQFIGNTQGTELPSTGGIGTTIFYIVGGLLLVGAAIVLVARRKAEN